MPIRLVTTPDGSRLATTPDGQRLLTSDDCNCCGSGSCWTGCGHVYVLAYACAQRPSGNCPAAVPPPAIGVRIDWSEFVHWPLGTRPTQEQLDATITVFFEGSCYTVRRNIFCPSDYSALGESSLSSFFADNPGATCPVGRPNPTLRLVRGEQLTIIGSCADDRCQARPGVVAYVPCGGLADVPVVYICANIAPGSPVVRLQAASGADLGCWCRQGESTLPVNASLFDGIVAYGSPTCCACQPGCSWYNDGTPAGCCCGRLELSTVKAGGSFTMIEQVDYGAGDVRRQTYSATVTGDNAVDADGCIWAVQTVRIITEFVYNGQPQVSEYADTGRVRVCAFCGPPCPIGWFGWVPFPIQSANNSNCEPGNGSNTVIDGDNVTASSWNIQRACGLSAIDESGSSNGPRGGALSYSMNYSTSAFILTRYSGANCGGDCVGQVAGVQTLEGMLP